MKHLVVLVLLMAGLTACAKNSANNIAPTATANFPINVLPLASAVPMPIEFNDKSFPIQPATNETYDMGRALYEQHCGSCHGLNGEGQQPNPLAVGMAPPHNDDGHTWHHADQQNFQTIWAGRDIAGTMPSFAHQLTPNEIIAVLAYIKTWWSEQSLTVQLERTQSVINN